MCMMGTDVKKSLSHSPRGYLCDMHGRPRDQGKSGLRPVLRDKSGFPHLGVFRFDFASVLLCVVHLGVRGAE
jgi:hypothetical protein